MVVNIAQMHARIAVKERAEILAMTHVEIQLQVMEVVQIVQVVVHQPAPATVHRLATRDALQHVRRVAEIIALVLVILDVQAHVRMVAPVDVLEDAMTGVLYHV